MSTNFWNDDVVYAFSIHRTLMRILGLWPLQKNASLSRIVQWCLTTITQLTIFIFLSMECAGNHHDADTSIETILFFSCTTPSVLKNFCLSANRKKLARNINAAISDWLTAKDDKKSYQIMKKYAFQSRIFTLILLYSSYTCVAIYIMAFIFINLKQTFQNTDLPDAKINTTNWMFVIPSGELGEKLNNPSYAVLTVFQSLQLITVGVMQCVTDSFYVNITLHLTGQLKVLKSKFQTFASKQDTDINHRKQLASLINRHCELIKLNQNVEDTFHLIILFQLVMVTLLLALLGLGIIFCLRDNNYVLLAKSILALNFVFMESVVYSYGGDFVQRGSEGIFHAIFATSWFTLPATLVKDLNFAMMRSNYPFRLSGGKFFYVNRETMVNVVKTAASYVSVLRLVLKE